MKRTILTSYFLAIVVSLCAMGQALAQSQAAYQAEVLSQSPTEYFTLDGTLASAINAGVVLTATGASGYFTTDAFRNVESCYAYIENSDDLRIITNNVISGGGTPSTNAAATGSISFVFKMLEGQNVGGQRWLFDAKTAPTTNNNTFALFLENETSTNNPNALKLQFGGSTFILQQPTNIAYGEWHYFAVTYDEARKPDKAKWYLGSRVGELITGSTTNDDDAVAGDGTGLFIGNRSNFNGAWRRPGSGRIDEFAIWDRELTPTEITNQFTKLPLPEPAGPTYDDIVEAQLPAYFFKLDDSLIDSVGNTLTLTANTTNSGFTTNVLGAANSAYFFAVTNDALWITNDLINGGGACDDFLDFAEDTEKGSISFVFRMLDDTNNTGGRYLFDQTADPWTCVWSGISSRRNSLNGFLEGTNAPNPNSLKLRMGGGTKGNDGSSKPTNNVPVAYPADLDPGNWHYFAMTYDVTRNGQEVGGVLLFGEVWVYFGPVGGTLTTQAYDPPNNSVPGDNGTFVIGNRADTFAAAFRNPGMGAVDNFAIFDDELTMSEIEAQFNAILASATAPTLDITQVGTDVLLSWLTAGSAGYNLESTPSLTPPATWSSNGPPPLVVGDSYVVTNAITGGEKYYRLAN